METKRNLFLYCYYWGGRGRGHTISGPTAFHSPRGAACQQENGTEMWRGLSCSMQPWAGGGSCDDRQRKRLGRRFALWPAPSRHPARPCMVRRPPSSQRKFLSLKMTMSETTKAFQQPWYGIGHGLSELGGTSGMFQLCSFVFQMGKQRPRDGGSLPEVLL